MSAIRPATCGAAGLVPETITGILFHQVRMYLPGDARLISGPLEEKLEISV